MWPHHGIGVFEDIQDSCPSDSDFLSDPPTRHTFFVELDYVAPHLLGNPRSETSVSRLRLIRPSISDPWGVGLGASEDYHVPGPVPEREPGLRAFRDPGPIDQRTEAGGGINKT
ncbi:hypothetical protein GCM10009831_09540 [Dietzia cercidiphylli]|uniref:Uncharacterized protein n=1 Tax=Dietzia cercidiphylli TaxID=498199 RepID=A0ABN2ICI7_9ACTN